MQEPHRFRYSKDEKFAHKNKQQEVQMQLKPEQLFVTIKNGEEDRYMFYAKNPDAWKKVFCDKYQNQFDTWLVHEFRTSDGTIMLHSNGKVVIHGPAERRRQFKEKFEGMKAEASVKAKEEEEKIQEMVEKVPSWKEGED